MTKRANPFTKIFVGMLAIIVIMLVFTFGSFGTDSDTVLSGYASTRKYATNSKKMQASVDIFKNAVDNKIQDEKDKQENLNKAGVAFSVTVDDKTYTLPAWGTVLEDDETQQYVDWVNALLPAAGLKKVGEYGAAGAAGSCAAFTNNVINKAVGSSFVSSNSIPASISSTAYTKKLAWRADPWQSLRFSTSNVEEAVEFFKNTTPGTTIRFNATYQPLTEGEKPPSFHSYLILGGNDEKVVIAESNYGKANTAHIYIKTWKEVLARGNTFGCVDIIIAPDIEGAKLPNGCYTSDKGRLLEPSDHQLLIKETITEANQNYYKYGGT